MDNPRGDIALGAVTGLVGAALLVPSYRESARVFLLPGDISPYFVPKIFIYSLVAISVAILVKGVLGLRRASSAGEPRNWPAVLATFAVALAAAALMRPMGYLVVAPLAVFATVWLLGFRNHLLNAAVALGVSIGLYLILVQLAGLTLPRAFWQG